jgi:hypothetical protein
MDILERLYERTKNEVCACLFFTASEKWATFALTNEMMHDKQPFIYISNETSLEDIEQLRERVRKQFPIPRIIGFMAPSEMCVLLKNAGYAKPNLEHYPEETHFLKGLLKYIWD